MGEFFLAGAIEKWFLAYRQRVFFSQARRWGFSPGRKGAMGFSSRILEVGVSRQDAKAQRGFIAVSDLGFLAKTQRRNGFSSRILEDGVSRQEVKAQRGFLVVADLGFLAKTLRRKGFSSRLLEDGVSR